ncbi:MAG: sugar kinase [Rhizobium sp.]|nr:sugar kinase [Rhizobium sp.]
MIELSAQGADNWHSSYAGDTFNTVWTMRGLLPQEVELDYVTAFGDDPFSLKQRDFFASNNIGVAASPTVKGGKPGLYAITLDGFERSFTYWRSDAAARFLADDVECLRESLGRRDLVYLSGITLAILSPKSRRILLAELGRIRRSKTIIAFDPNYRSRLWRAPEEARIVIEEALSIADIALPTFQDEQDLFADREPQHTIERLLSAGVKEVVVKAGSGPALFAGEGSSGTVCAEYVEKPIDTTGAGDAFNGGYLASRLQGRSINEACGDAHRIAAISVMSRGALTPLNLLERFRDVAIPPAISLD